MVLEGLNVGARTKTKSSISSILFIIGLLKGATRVSVHGPR